MTHCISIMTPAHFAPSSRFMDAIAATQGVYNRQNTNNAAAEAGVRISNKPSVDLNKTDNVDTTLSFAINPVINAVEILQSPNPKGLKIGAISPAITAKILSLESVTTLRCRLKVCKNHMIIVARKITVNAFSKKSFAFSHSNCITFFNPGIR